MVQKDHGHAWLVLVAAVGHNFLLGFIGLNIGLLTNALLDTLDVNLFQASWFGSTFMAVVLMSGPITGIIHRKVGARKASFTAGVLCCAGLVLSSYMRSIVGLLCSFSLVAGLGMSLAVNVMFSVPGHYFEKRKSFAFAIIMSSSGLGLFPGSFLLTYLIEEYLFSGTLLIMGSITLHMCVAGMLIVDVDEESRLQNGQSSNINHKQNSKDKNLSCYMKLKSIFSLIYHCFQLMKNRAFVAFLVGILFWGIGESCIYLHLPNFVVSKGSTPWEASTVIALLGIAVIFSKFFGGLLGSDPAVGYYIPISAMNGLAGVFSLLMPLMSHTFQLQCLSAILCGLHLGGPVAYLTVVTIDIVGLSEIEIGMGFVTLLFGVGYLIGPPLASWVYSLTGIYDNTFFLAGSSLLLCFACLSVVPSLKTKEEPKDNTKEVVVSTVSNMVTVRL